MQLERRGKITVTIVTETFTTLAKAQTKGLELPSLPIVFIPHPVGGLSPEDARKRLDGRLDDLAQAVIDSSEAALRPGPDSLAAYERSHPGGRVEQPLEQIDLDDTLGAFRVVNDLFYKNGWTDGLPIVPPVESEVERFLESWGRSRDSLVAVIPPVNGLATLEKIAVNMVMAGCEPEYLPVIEAALLALGDEGFYLITILTSTGMQAPLLIVSGPIVQRLGLNPGANAFGQGNRANATIGRALRLIFLNVGGCVPGVVDRSTQGHPGKYSYVLAENGEANPWNALHVDYGLSEEASAVTMVAGQPPCLIKDSVSSTGLGILHSISSAMAVPDCVNYNNFGDQVLVLCPEHAAALAADGFSKDDIRQYVLQNARVPITRFTPAFIEKQGRFRWAKQFNLDNPSTMIPILEKPEDLIVVVAGGPGKHSSFVPTHCQARRVTREIRLPG